MRKVALVGIDSAGGVITGPGATRLTVNGIKVSLLGDRVAGHGDGAHRGPTMVQGSSVLRVDGIPVVLQGHSASCSHTATGSAILTCTK